MWSKTNHHGQDPVVLWILILVHRVGMDACAACLLYRSSTGALPSPFTPTRPALPGVRGYSRTGLAWMRVPHVCLATAPPEPS